MAALLLCLLLLGSCISPPGHPNSFVLEGAPRIRQVQAFFDDPLPASAGAGSVAVYSGLRMLLIAELRGGAGPLEEHWDFGGGATVDHSLQGPRGPEDLPGSRIFVVPSAPGSYPASVTITNALGSATHAFMLVVSAPPLPTLDPLAFLPGKLYPGTTASLDRGDAGGLVQAWRWDFGGGTTPNVVDADSEALSFGPAGSYSASVTVSNPAGTRTIPFTLVVGGLDPPDIAVRAPLRWASGNLEPAHATNSGGPVETWRWEYNGAVVLGTDDRQENAVKAGPPGEYRARVTATNSAGSDSVEFTIIVKPFH